MTGESLARDGIVSTAGTLPAQKTDASGFVDIVLDIANVGIGLNKDGGLLIEVNLNNF